jgi:hypothetical protein
MIIYLWTNIFPAEIFSTLCLLSVLKLMAFMRFIPSLAVFIELFQASLRDMKEFMAFLMLMIMAFTAAFYYNSQMSIFEVEERPSFFQIFQETLFLGFGDFGATENFKNEEGPVKMTFNWFLYFYLLIIIFLVLMNLLIAVISDTFAKTMEKIKQASNSQMSDVLLELETFIFWNREKKEEGYCVFAEYVNEDEDSDSENEAQEREEI